MLILWIMLIVFLIVVFLATYKVVLPNEAHVVVVMGRGRKVYYPKIDKEGKKGKTAYFYIPFLMKRYVLPLTNVKMGINNIPLNDMEVAPFICDVITWIHIDDPIRAAERLDLTHAEGTFGSLREDLINIVQAVARAVSMKHEIIGIMRDRKQFSDTVSAEVNGVLDSWGIELVDLEVNDIRDDEGRGSHVIGDYESIRKAKINTKARKEISVMDREAIEIEQDNKQKAEVATAQAEETFRKKQIDRDKNVGMANQYKEMEIATKTEEANKQKVEANRTLIVGNADVEKEAVVKKAEGEGEAIRVTGEKEADVITLKGQADGNAIEAKGTAEALVKDKMADAMQKFNEAATGVEKIRAWIEVEKAKYSALGTALSSADLKLVQSGKGGNIFGFPMNAETGADMGQMLEGFGNSEIKDFVGDLIKKTGGKDKKD